MTPTSPSPARPPTRVRYAVVLVTTLVAFLLYLDRICMAEVVKSPSFLAELNLDKGQIGTVLGAFFFAYALAQVPAGWLSDRFGARSMMTFYIAVWSLFTALSGLAQGMTALLVARLGLGLAQAGAYPTSSGLLSKWVTFEWRATASSIVAFGGRTGLAFASLLTALLIGLLGNWRSTLILYGVLGGVVAWLFWTVFRNRPEEHPRCNQAECELIEHSRPAGMPSPHGRARRVPLGPLVTDFSMWCSSATQFFTNMGWAFLGTWLPTYLSEVKHVEPIPLGNMVAVALFVGMGGMLVGGYVTDWSTRQLGVRWGRSLPLAVSRFVAAGAYVACLWLDSPWALVTAFAVVAFATDVGVAPFWAFSQDVGGRHVGSVLGWANMWGNFGAAAIARLVPFVLATWDINHDWHEAFLFFAANFVLSGITALGMNAAKPLCPDPDSSTARG